MPEHFAALSFYGLLASLLLAERLRPHAWRAQAVTAGALLPGGLASLTATLRPANTGVFVAEVAAIVLARDLLGYWQHRLLHGVPLFWRAHRVHHSDRQVDVTTGVRHHPLETALSLGIAAAFVAGVGMSVASLGVALGLARLAAVYQHTSLDLPASLDRRLRRLLVTPSVHRLHHSRRQPQTDSNFGTVFTLWDRLFGTYRDPAAAPLEALGLDAFDGEAEETLVAALTQPFRSPAAGPVPERSPA